MVIINKNMPEPPSDYNYVDHVIQFIKDIAPFGSAVWISRIFIDRIFKEREIRQNKRLREIAEEVMRPEIADLKDSIEKLTKAFGAVEVQLRNRN